MTSKVNEDGQFNPIIPPLSSPLASLLPSAQNLGRLTLLSLCKPAAVDDSTPSTGRGHHKYK
jgi:hypothetical protein